MIIIVMNIVMTILIHMIIIQQRVQYDNYNYILWLEKMKFDRRNEY